MLFEIHITGNYKIHFACKYIGVKTIIIDLLQPTEVRVSSDMFYHNRVNKEHMTSFTYSGTKEDVFKETLRVIGEISKHDNTKINRIKIESMFDESLVDDSLYMETHFNSNEFKLPTSLNVTNGNLTKRYLATDRTYNKSRYKEFMNKYTGNELELCIFDSFVHGDKKWFDFYKKELFDAKHI